MVFSSQSVVFLACPTVSVKTLCVSPNTLLDCSCGGGGEGGELGGGEGGGGEREESEVEI